MNRAKPMEPAPTADALPSQELYGFRRTVCGCEFCRAPCKHMPGTLDVTDLARLCPEGQELIPWAEEHLRALTDKSVPTLVPVRQANGSCHLLFDGQCAVHEHSPFGCAYFDTHMTDEEAQQRAEATINARREDAAHHGPYFQVWQHLCRKGLTARSGDRPGLARDLQALQNLELRSRRRQSP